MNAHHLLIPLLPLLISGCSLFGWTKVDPIQVEKKAVERTHLNIPDLPPLKHNSEVKWVLITPENAQKVWKELKDKNIDMVLFGLTDDGYEAMAVTMAELRNHIAQQRAIIIKYKEYYEPQKPAEK